MNLNSWMNMWHQRIPDATIFISIITHFSLPYSFSLCSLLGTELWVASIRCSQKSRVTQKKQCITQQSFHTYWHWVYCSHQSYIMNILNEAMLYCFKYSILHSFLTWWYSRKHDVITMYAQKVKCNVYSQRQQTNEKLGTKQVAIMQ